MIDDDVLGLSHQETEGTILEPIKIPAQAEFLCLRDENSESQDYYICPREGATLKVISLCLPKECHNREDICLLFIVLLVFNLQKKKKKKRLWTHF